MSCLAIVLNGPKTTNGRRVFDSFKCANQKCIWNRDLALAADSLIYMGFLRPQTLFVSAPGDHLQSLKSAWVRRTLKAAEGYQITSVGELGEMKLIEQMNFIPLGDVICDTIAQLTRTEKSTTLTAIHNHIGANCPDVAPLNLEIVHKTIMSLIGNGLLYRLGDSHFVSIPAPSSKSSSMSLGIQVDSVNGSKREYNRKRDDSGALIKNKSSKANDMCEGPSKFIDKRNMRKRRRERNQFSSASTYFNYGPIDTPNCLLSKKSFEMGISAITPTKHVPRTSTPIKSNWQCSSSSATDYTEEPTAWSEPENDKLQRLIDGLQDDHTYVNLKC